MKAIDPLTGEEFEPKKKSQRFACPANRIKYNNQKAIKLRESRSFLDKHVHKNHLILKEICGNRKENIFNMYFLEGKGFRFDATNHDMMFQNRFERCVYEFIVIPVENSDNFKIINHDRY
ncbi:hypothetical protein [Flavobacterium sp.]|uniref:hypothetical protein n=1 Tax=Flavobacterium sp. TaxID=239 RepID=UPI00286B1720|nr:hypothetical protein [Flavobacterium sp.]